MELDFRGFQLHLVIKNGGFGRFVVGLGGFERLANIGVVECGEKLALGYVRALVEENARDTAGDFRGDGGAAARGDVTAGVEQSFAATVIRGLLYERDLHDRLLIPEAEDGARNAAKYDEQSKEDSKALAPTAAGAVTVINAQR